MSTIKANAWQNLDGSENFKCRAWVKFNGTGTVAIRAAGNVSSITDNGVGDYSANFTTPMPDAEYAQVFGNSQGAGNNPVNFAYNTNRINTTTAAHIAVAQAAIRLDVDFICMAIFR